MPETSVSVPAHKPTARARISNGATLLPGVDGRSAYARRMRDLMALYLGELGGPDAVSEAERSMVRRAATLTAELERMETRFAMGDADAHAVDAYQRAAGSLRRLLASVGLQRRPRAA